MATNPWISQSVRSEQNLYEDLVIESLRLYGQDVYYIPREIVNKDKVFLDDVPSRFSDAYKVEMYIENTDAFGGEGDLFSKFGVELRDQATFIVARRRWKSLIGDKLDSYNFRPREGDLIFLPLSQSIFEIFKVETETPFYQLSQLPTFKLQCELFEYNDEDFDTDIDGIDIVEDESAYQYKLVMDTPSEATAEAVSNLDVDGKVIGFDVSSRGKGYLTSPTISIETVVGSNSKFGNASLNVSKGRGSEGVYTQTGLHGTIESWVYVDNLPVSGQRIIFKTGGSDDEPEKTYFWGIDPSGRLVYSRGNNLGGTVTTLTGTSVLFLENTWHHILIGGFNTNNIVIYFDFTKQLDTTLAGVTFDLMTNEGYSVGATAARTVDGVNWEALDGFIDEFRVQVGSRSQILEPRYTTPGDSTILDTQSAEWPEDITYDAKILHFNAISATATSTITSDGRLQSIELSHAGLYYDEIPTVTISAPYSGGNYKRNTTVSQDQNSFIMRGEVAKWSDSDNTLYLVHVGATDGQYHTFNTTNAVVSDDATYAPSLIEELNQIQSVGTVGNDVVAQNDYFDDFEANFLNFSENNPFGDVS